MSLRDTILQSESAKKMIEMVTPIYDESYIGLWMFEIIGRKLDELKASVETYPIQAFPETATWSMRLWAQLRLIAEP